MTTMNTPTADLHQAAEELHWLATHTRIDQPTPRREIFLHLETLAQAIAELSERLDALEGGKG